MLLSPATLSHTSFFSLLRACLVLSEKKQDQIFTTNPESSHLKLTSCSLERTFKIPKGLQNKLWQKKKKK